MSLFSNFMQLPDDTRTYWTSAGLVIMMESFRFIEPQHAVTFGLVPSACQLFIIIMYYTNVQVRQGEVLRVSSVAAPLSFTSYNSSCHSYHTSLSIDRTLFYIRVLFFLFLSPGRCIDIQSCSLFHQLFTQWLCCALKYAKEHHSKTLKKLNIGVVNATTVLSILCFTAPWKEFYFMIVFELSISVMLTSCVDSVMFIFKLS